MPSHKPNKQHWYEWPISSAVVPVVMNTRFTCSLAVQADNTADGARFFFLLWSWLPRRHYMWLPWRWSGIHLLSGEYNHSCYKWVWSLLLNRAFSSTQQFAAAPWEHWSVKWLVPFYCPVKPFCTAHTLFPGLFIVFATSFSFLHSWVPLPAVGSVPVLRREDGAVGVPRASLHGHRCSQRTCPVSNILCHQVTTPPPSNTESSVRMCETKWLSS